MEFAGIEFDSSGALTVFLHFLRHRFPTTVSIYPLTCSPGFTHSIGQLQIPNATSALTGPTQPSRPPAPLLPDTQSSGSLSMSVLGTPTPSGTEQ